MLKLYRLFFWICVVVTLVMALDPHPPDLHAPDKVQHAFAFVVLYIGAALAYPSVPLFGLGVILSAFGALIELLQAIPMFHRDADVRDWIADTLALAGAYVLIRVAKALLSTRNPDQ